MEIWAYARVSTHDQVEDRNALAKQQRRLRAAGATRIYYDVDSRTSDNRDGLNLLIEDINKSSPGAIAKFLFIRVDRLTCSNPTFYKLMSALNSKGIKAEALDEPFDMSSIGGELTIDIRLAAAKYEVQMIRKRIQEEKKYRRKNKLPHHRTPLGYKLENDKYVKDETPCVCIIEGKIELTRSQLARFVFDVFFQVGSAHATVRRMHDILGVIFSKTRRIDKQSSRNVICEDEEIKDGVNVAPASSGFAYPYTGLRWSDPGLKTMLVNPVYAGGTPYNTVREGRNKGRKHFDQWEIEWNTHEDQAIISREEHELIKKIIRSNQHNRWASSSGDTVNPYAGILRCAVCGGSYVRCSGRYVKKINAMYYYYRCSLSGTGACDNKSMFPSGALDQAIAQGLAKKAVELSKFVEEEEHVKESKEIQDLRTSLIKLESITGIPEIEKAKDEIRLKISNLIMESSSVSKKRSINRDEIISAFSDPNLWSELSLQDKKNLLRKCVSKIFLEGRNVLEIILAH